MNKSGAGQAGKAGVHFRSSFRLASLLLLLLCLFSVAIETQAAEITFAPGEVSVTAAPGEVVAVPVEISLIDTTVANSYAFFSLSRVDGTLDPAWINTQFFVSLNSSYMKRLVNFLLKVPADARHGAYKSIYRTIWLRSNEQVSPADLVVNVEVSEVMGCNQAPLFSDISSAEDTINARNNKEVAIDLAGVVSVPEGCDVVKAWYQLTDEYGELDRTGPLEINDDGTFSVAVPMVASRKGEDKDGRLYTVTFMAENEAGVGESPETSVVVLHDNRKK